MFDSSKHFPSLGATLGMCVCVFFHLGVNFRDSGLPPSSNNNHISFCQRRNSFIGPPSLVEGQRSSSQNKRSWAKEKSSTIFFWVMVSSCTSRRPHSLLERCFFSLCFSGGGTWKDLLGIYPCAPSRDNETGPHRFHHGLPDPRLRFVSLYPVESLLGAIHSTRSKMPFLSPFPDNFESISVESWTGPPLVVDDGLGRSVALVLLVGIWQSLASKKTHLYNRIFDDGAREYQRWGEGCEVFQGGLGNDEGKP